MRKEKRIRLFIASLSVAVVLCSITLAYSTTYTVVELTDATFNEGYPRINDNGEMAWIGYYGVRYTSKIFLYDGSSIIPLTDDEFEKRDLEINNNGFVVWMEKIGPLNEEEYEIFLYDGSSIIQLTDNLYGDWYPKINDKNQVVWLGGTGVNSKDIFLYDYDSKTLKQLTTDAIWRARLQINDNGNLVWLEQPPGSFYFQIYLYDGLTIHQLTYSETIKGAPQINNNYVVWHEKESTSDFEIFLFNGSTTIQQLTDNDYDDYLYAYRNNNSINDEGHVVWTAHIPNEDSEIFLYDGISIIQVTNNGYNDGWSQINNKGNIAWMETGPSGVSQTYLYDGSTIHQLSNDAYFNKQRPALNNNGYVVWLGQVGMQYNIFLAKPEGDSDGDGIPDDQDACPKEDASGFDADVDGCIDTMTGLSEILETLVTAGVIAEELQNSLLSKVENADKSADKDNICAAVNKLEALINEVNAQRDKKISIEAADDVIDYANSVISWLLDQLAPGETC